MAIGNVGSDSFDFYEGIRIVLPGGLLVALFEAVVATTTNAGGVLVSQPALAFAATIGMGLLAYFIDVPSRSAIYLRDLPSNYFEENYAPHLKDWLNAFFVVSDETMPPGIRARALYMGSMFRIG